jgi:hypothetical protein
MSYLILEEGKPMKNPRILLRLAVAVLTLAAVFGQTSSAGAQGKTTTFKAYVIDSACTFIKNLKKPVNPACAVACAKAGSPLVLQTASGVIYWPISDATPAQGLNDRLLEYAGKQVSVTGKVFDKGGSHAIVIEKIAAVSSDK